MFASSSLEEIYHYVYYQIVSLATTMLDEVNGYTVDLFSNSVISSILGFFSTLAWGLGLLGAVIAVMDFGVSYRTGGGGSFLGTGMNMLRLLIALLTFSSIPVLLFQFSMDIYGSVRTAAVGSMSGSSASISDLAKGAIDSMFQSVYGSLPSTQLTGGIWSFLKQLQDGFQMTDVTDAAFNTNANWWALIQLVVLVWAIFKIFFGNLKRGGILLVQICVGSLHMLSLARGYTDGFSAWCKQVAATCFTAFVQNLLYLLALIMLQDAETTNLYFGLGLMLVAAEVPRIAQMFGLDTSTRGNISSVVHTTSSVFTLVRQFAR
ncbi:MAG: conjugal transfer protein TrbL family protein [Acutalibacteraceae bacterium]